MMTKVFSVASAAVIALFAVVPLSFAGSRGDSNRDQSSVTTKTEDRTPAKPAVRLSENEALLVKAVNAYRARKGLKPLTVDPVLMKVGRNAAPYFSHNINGKWCWTRAQEA